MVYGTQNELVTGANLDQLITGGPHIVKMVLTCFNQKYSSLQLLDDD